MTVQTSPPQSIWASRFWRGAKFRSRTTDAIIDYPLESRGPHRADYCGLDGQSALRSFHDDARILELDDAEFARLGREFEHHPFFPHRVNTEFILPLSRDRLRMRVWERGSGETLACGTGACAALVAAVLTGHAERSATVELRGGNLEIEWREHGDRTPITFL